MQNFDTGILNTRHYFNFLLYYFFSLNCSAHIIDIVLRRKNSNFAQNFQCMFRKRTEYSNLYTLGSRDGWSCIYFMFTHTPPINLYSGLPLSSKQNTHALTHSSLPLLLIQTSRTFEIKYALTLAVRKTQLKYTLRYLANKFAIFLIEFSLLLTTS